MEVGVIMDGAIDSMCSVESNFIIFRRVKCGTQ